MRVAIVALLILLCPASGAHAAPELDQTFSGDGVTTLDFDPNDLPDDDYDVGQDVAVDSQGRILVAGRGPGAGGWPGGGALVRYESDGSLDESLAGDGKLLAADNPILNGVGVTGVTVQPDGKILIVAADDGDDSTMLARLNGDGSTDESFSNDGVARVAAYPGNHNLALSPNGTGTIVVSGNRNGRHGRFVVARFNSDGSRDTSFGQHGISVTESPGRYGGSSALAVGADGRVVVSGTAGFDHFSQLIILRLTEDGAIDRAFSGDGWRVVRFENYAGNSGGYVTGECGRESGIAVAPGGGIAVAANLVRRADAAYDPTDIDFAIARLRENGDFEKSFSGDGRTTVGFGDDWACPHTVGLLPQVRTMVSGGADNSLATAVLSPSGHPVQSFSGNGRSSIEFDLKAVVNSSAVMSDGRFVVAGTIHDYRDYAVNFNHDFAVARFDALD